MYLGAESPVNTNTNVEYVDKKKDGALKHTLKRVNYEDCEMQCSENMCLPVGCYNTEFHESCKFRFIRLT